MDCGVDPLKWDLKWINGICYRLHPEVDLRSRERIIQQYPEEDDVEDYVEDNEPGCSGFSEEETNNQEANICLRYHVPDRYLGRLCGQQHSRRKEIEADTGASIRIPSKGSNDDIVILGNTHQSVEECLARIQAIVKQARLQDCFTHFISIPLTFDVVKRNLQEFQCMAMATSSTLTKELFVRPCKLHLTICCLSLQDKTEVAQASEILLGCEDLIAEHVGKEPIVIWIRGLEIMNDDPDMVDVLYAKIVEKERNDAGRLQDLCDAIVTRLRQSSLMADNLAIDRDHLKLHMTVVNSKFAKEPHAVVDSSHKSRRGSCENVKAFSAKKILEILGDQDFGEVQLNEMQLNVVSQVEPSTGYYRNVAKLGLHTNCQC
ncbi:activating signal cointegrator 1 complex subunit 1-like [Varroa destructor]|uniref:K Homology domain-containing protein n=1 Tax=Varroa destructor TaxID=109461 RepID=A0A7M7JVT9_VARDE|nr:activating signal cointegrator 1 complex subunit 1-like [Varroa destructor]XP_022657689.1 activating signal cointegrator 1 complex subunit 1-like [Varroa destructor]XP_022657690.1 activating signal cointegrator 1 complex subunit 1-like [Varroa destructor]